jgi:hypothetical protein
VESEVQEAAKVPRSELDTAFDVCGGGGRMVVSFVQTTPWGYDVWVGSRVSSALLSPAMVVSKDW